VLTLRAVAFQSVSSYQTLEIAIDILVCFRLVRSEVSVMLPKLNLAFIRNDITAGFVVFLVALPLCLGIALASEAPPIAGLITGVVAGLLVSLISGSELSVSGPAAGLTITVIAIQRELGSFDGLLVATVLAGIFQMILGAIRAGHMAAFFPSCVIKGMLAGIGIIIIFKQLPLAVGWSGQLATEDGAFCILNFRCLNSIYSLLTEPHTAMSLAALSVSIPCIYLLLIWEDLAQRIHPCLKVIPGPLVAVLIGVVINALFLLLAPELALTAGRAQLVAIPELKSFSEFVAHGPSNITAWLAKPKVWSSALVISLIASVETLLCIEAVDRLDPFRRISRPNRELTAQGIGNVVAGLCGGVPMTSVIVRSSANVYAGGKTRIASFVHGILLLVSTVALFKLLNQVPLAALAAILIVIGHKLANRKLMLEMWRSGYSQFIPFIITVVCVVMLDLLSGVVIGTVLGLIAVLLMNHHLAFTLVQTDGNFYLRFAKDATFLQKIALKRTLAQLPSDSSIFIDGGGAMFIDHDIQEVIADFTDSAVQRNIEVTMNNMPETEFNLLAALGRRR
jgi:MFS superfamily sulfate permease-like transporter